MDRHREKPLKSSRDNPKKKKSPPDVKKGVQRKRRPNSVKALKSSTNVNGNPDNVIKLKTRKRNRNKKQNTSTRDFALIFVCLILFFISVGGSLLSYATRKEISTMVVPYGSIELTQNADGIIVRDEMLYTAGADGVAEFVINDKEKVKKGTIVCNIKNPSETRYLEQETQALSQKILEIQEKRSDYSVFGKEVAAYNNKIKSEIEKNIFHYTDNDYNYVYKLKQTVSADIDRRNNLLLNENNGSVGSAVSENRQYTEKLSNAISKISVGESGVISLFTDGFEENYNFGNMEEIRKEETKMKVVKEDEKNIEVSSGDHLFKLIKSNEWYIVSYIDNNLISSWEENNTVSIYIEKDGDYNKLETKVYKLQKGEKESFVILRANKQMLDYAEMRSVSFKTYDSIYSGIKIPENAITERTFLKIPASYTKNVNGRDIVYKKINDKVEEAVISIKSLKIEGEAGEYIYIMQDFNNVKRGDILVGPEDHDKTYSLDDLVTSKGVFKANSGIASFTSISAEGMIKGANGYVILPDDSGGAGIKPYDIIVSDAVHNYIEEGDKIN